MGERGAAKDSRGVRLRVMGSWALAQIVEGLCCKRPIQCLAPSEILTPHPLTARRVCTPPPWCGGRTLAGWRGGGGQ
jgi:hypothetical protein